MGVISRGFKNAFRNTIRTVSITFILGLSVAMALIMLLALKTVDSKINSVKSSIGNTITVSPAGVRGFEGGGELLTTQNATDIGTIEHVTKVKTTITDRLTKDSNTSLDSAVEPGSFGNRQQRQSSRSNQSEPTPPEGNTAGTGKNFTMPITLTGVNEISAAAVNGSQLTITSGDKFDSTTSENVAIIGSELATKNSLTVGSTFQVYSTDIKVVGIYDAGNKFANAGVIMPFKSVQTLTGQTDQVNSITVQTDSIDSQASVVTAIKEKLGSDKVDVVSSEDSSKNAITPLENIKTISLYSLIGSLVAGSVIILLTMIMIVRERRREIGVLKAIGSSNIKIVSQFTVESLVLTIMSSVLGILLGIIFSNPVLKVLVNNSESTGTTMGGPGGSGGAGGPGGGFGGGMMRLGENAVGALRDIHAVINYEIVLYGLLAAIVIAIIGSAIPSFFISKIRPAEVMRAE